MAIFWPFFYSYDFAMANKLLVLQWILGCLFMSIFTLLPAIKFENSNTM